jgi:hypothetical protein
MQPTFQLTEQQAARLRNLVRRYDPPKMKKRRTPNQLWLRVLSQVVVAGNSAPAEILGRSKAVEERLAFSRLKKLTPRQRYRVLHRVLQAIGTRYVGKKSPNAKVDAAVHNFNALVKAGGPRQFFERVKERKTTAAKVEYLSEHLKYYKKKGCRDTLIELRLAKDCMALDLRIRKILEGVGVKIDGSVDRQYQQIETELINKVAKPRLTGGQLDRILFQNYGDIMVRLRCP